MFKRVNQQITHPNSKESKEKNINPPNKQQKNKGISKHTTIITLNANNLNLPIKKYREKLSDWI